MSENIIKFYNKKKKKKKTEKHHLESQKIFVFDMSLVKSI